MVQVIQAHYRGNVGMFFFSSIVDGLGDVGIFSWTILLDYTGIH